MFVQIIEGKLRDAGLLDRQMARWQAQIKPGASGYLGSTSGVTDDGTGITLVRFDSPDSARANSARPEQGAWWAETSQAFDGEVVFHDCQDVDLIFGGGSDEAGFVQVMQGRAADQERMRTVGRSMEDELRAMRPDVLGGVVCWHGDRDFTQVMYFTSEDEARKGEAASQQSAEMDEWGKQLDGPVRFLDLRHPEYD
jgi:hypothetical protein